MTLKIRARLPVGIGASSSSLARASLEGPADTSVGPLYRNHCVAAWINARSGSVFDSSASSISRPVICVVSSAASVRFNAYSARFHHCSLRAFFVVAMYAITAATTAKHPANPGDCAKSGNQKRYVPQMSRRLSSTGPIRPACQKHQHARDRGRAGRKYATTHLVFARTTTTRPAVICV